MLILKHNWNIFSKQTYKHMMKQNQQRTNKSLNSSILLRWTTMLPEEIAMKWKISMSGIGYCHISYYSWEHQRHPKQEDYFQCFWLSTEQDSMSLLQQTSHSSVTGQREINLEEIRKVSPCRLGYILLENAIHPGEKKTSVVWAMLDPTCYNSNLARHNICTCAMVARLQGCPISILFRFQS